LPFNHFNIIKQEVLQRLQADLPAWMIYHDTSHTLDVLEQSERIAATENITDTEDLFLLKTAALYHDTGFINVYKGHEEVGCEIAVEMLGKYSFNDRHLDTVCGMIMATKLPQQPKNKLEQIIADADLDYLGRPDYYPKADALQKEFLREKMIATEADWIRLQISFLEGHRYFTATNKTLRLPLKNERIKELKALLQRH